MWKRRWGGEVEEERWKRICKFGISRWKKRIKNFPNKSPNLSLGNLDDKETSALLIREAREYLEKFFAEDKTAVYEFDEVITALWKKGVSMPVHLLCS